MGMKKGDEPPKQLAALPGVAYFWVGVFHRHAEYNISIADVKCPCRLFHFSQHRRSAGDTGKTASVQDARRERGALQRLSGF
jgi:hypothetical protein